MRKSKFSESQILAVLGEGEAGVPVADLCRKHGISNACHYQWKSKFAGMSANELWAAAPVSKTQAIDPSVSASSTRSFVRKLVPSVFHYTNTAIARSGLDAYDAKLKLKKVSIVGVGGTGSYILDAIAKTPAQRSIYLTVTPLSRTTHTECLVRWTWRSLTQVGQRQRSLPRSMGSSGPVGCCRIQRHFVKVLNETGGCQWTREGNTAGNSSLRL